METKVLMFMCKSNEGYGSGNGCMKKAEQNISFFAWSPSLLTSLTSSVDRLNRSGDGDVRNQAIKIIKKKISSQALLGDSTPNLASVFISASVSFI